MWYGSSKIIMDDYWYKSKLDRFSNREEVLFNILYENYFSKYDVPKECVLECLEILQELYKVPVGKFRPDDLLKTLLDVVKSPSVYTNLTYELYDSEMEDQFDEALDERLKKNGAAKFWVKVETILDCVLAWCGKHPNQN